MANYLAVDFGTSNCAAGYLEQRDGSLKLKLVPLDATSEYCPSVIFAQNPNLNSLEINSDQYERRVELALKHDEEKIQQSRCELEGKVAAFIKKHGPKLKSPERGDYLSDRQFQSALEAYKRDLLQLEVAKIDFMVTRVAKYRASLEESLRSKHSEDFIRNMVRKKMFREAFEKRRDEFWDSSFFGALLDDKKLNWFGSEAVKKYSEDPLSGFFMRSPKAFLAIELAGQQREIFVRAVSKIISKIKKAAEDFTGQVFDGIILGRPVNFRGANDEAGNARASSILVDASSRAGFMEINFVLEPLAASLAIAKRALNTYDPIVVIDIGGGTTDLAYIEVGNAQGADFQVKAVTGERLGGNDFDEAIAWGLVAPFLGKGCRLKDGKPVPYSVIDSALKTRDIHAQSAFRKSGPLIEEFLGNADPDSIIPLERLEQLFSQQLQHKVLLKSEELKIRSTSLESSHVTFDDYDSPFEVSLDQSSLERLVDGQLSRLKELLLELLKVANNDGRPVRAFLTGGMSSSPAILALLRRELPTRSTIDQMPPLKSVVGGLAIVSYQLNRAATASVFLPDVVRGVPIIRG